MSVKYLSAVKRSTMSEFFEFPQKQLYFSVPIVESLPRRTFVRRRSTFGDSASFLTPHDNRKAQTETENAMSKNLMSIECLSLRNSQQCRNSSNSLKSIYISVPIVESLPRRTLVRRRSAFGDLASFLTPPKKTKTKTALRLVGESAVFNVQI